VGNDGLTVPVDADGRAVMMRHLGGLSIGRGVHIGPNTTVGRGTLDQAEIGEGCVIGPQVNIGHNTHIEADCILTGGCRLGGGVRLGRGAWIGTGAVIHQKVKIGAGAVVGGGAVITRDVPEKATIAAVPGGSPRDVAQLRRLLQGRG
ncbi:MAG: hypothetical protein MK085_12505, partial [Phycisphaerales bacterium]|nr:hypothetical protein [Phycisphaerales bacterium]